MLSHVLSERTIIGLALTESPMMAALPIVQYQPLVTVKNKRHLLGQLRLRLSQDLAGDPKHIYKHKIQQESAPSRGS